MRLYLSHTAKAISLSALVHAAAVAAATPEAAKAPESLFGWQSQASATPAAANPCAAQPMAAQDATTTAAVATDQPDKGSAVHRDVPSSPHHTNVHAKQHGAVAADPSLRQVSPRQTGETPANNPSSSTLSHRATVLEAIDAPEFSTTYLRIDADGEVVWVAAQKTDVAAGNVIAYSPADMVVMEEFESKALHRTFDKIFLLPEIAVVTNETP